MYMGRHSDDKGSLSPFNVVSQKLSLKTVNPEKYWYLLIKVCKKIAFFWSRSVAEKDPSCTRHKLYQQVNI